MDTSNKPTILIVDDTAENLLLMNELLCEQYGVRLAKSGAKALAAVTIEPIPDLILLDIMMPDLDGYSVCTQLKENPATHNIPVIFLTAKQHEADEERGLLLGAVDYITKPISPAILLARVKNHLQLKQTADFLRDKSAFLESEVARRSAELAAIQDVTIFSLASLAETRDNDTGGHIRRTQIYVKLLAEKLRNKGVSKDLLTDAYIDTLYKSAPLHDIGKVGIPDRILLKPGKFTFDEFEIMKTHTTLGRDAIIHAERTLGKPVAFLSCAKEIAYYHQEKWDGSGYPEGLKGEKIPLSARLMALADVYDALISRRVYKPEFSHDQAVEIIRQGKGTHFDPDVIDAFEELISEFAEVAREFKDSDISEG